MKQKNKIAIFHCGFIYTGGGERIVIEEIVGLRKCGYLVDCFVPIYDPRLSYPDIIKDLDIKTFLPQLPSFVPFRFGILMVLSCLLSPFLACRFTKYDLILGANQPGAFIAWVVSILLRKSYFVYLSQPNRILYPRDHENWQNIKDYYLLSKVINKLFKQLVSFLDQKSITGGKNLFINGSFVAKEICRIYKPKFWIDCPGGAHTPSRSILKVNRLVGKAMINGFTIERPYLLLTSRHEPWKKFEWAIQALKLVATDYPKIKLIIPGAETAITLRLRRLVKSLKISQNVIFLGTITQKNLWKLYEQAAIYVFPSPKEDLGIVVIEAQAYGLPVVAWNFGGPTVTVVNGKTGYLAKPYDIPDFTQKINSILRSEERRKEMGTNAWEHIKNNFSWKRHLDILQSEFKKYS
ncbi:MAG: glycosyltransferase family 4 protein [bacterium]|nr:glycosyltransferase family 4 protein [bacterium]